TTVFNFRLTPASLHQAAILSTRLTIEPSPRPNSTLRRSTKLSHETAMISRRGPYSSSHRRVTLLPLLTIETLSNPSSVLQNTTSGPSTVCACKNGSPPVKFNLRIPASRSSFSPCWIARTSRMYLVLYVWKQYVQL